MAPCPGPRAERASRVELIQRGRGAATVGLARLLERLKELEGRLRRV